jgi:hypothetical protein
MGVIDWLALSQSFPSIVVAVLFAAFAVILINEQRKNASTTMKEWRDWFTRRDEEWLNAIKTMNDERNTSTARIAEEVKGLARCIEAQNALLVAHDTRTQEYIEHQRIKENADKDRGL